MSKKTDKNIPLKERKRNREYGFKLADRNIFKEELKDSEQLIKMKLEYLKEWEQQ